MHTSDLHILIKSLTRTEKTYIRKSARFQKTSAGYIRLFKAIDDLDYYDENCINEKFSGEKFLRQLPVAKNYLYHAILRDLTHYSSNATAKGRLNRLLAEAHVLFEKRLYAQAEKAVNACERFAFRHEMFNELLRTLEQEFNIIAAEQIYDKKADRLMEHIYKLRNDTIKILRNLYQYDLLQHRFVSFLHRHMDSQDRKFINTIDRMIGNSLLKDEDMALSTISKMKFNHIMSNYYYVKRDFSQSYKHLKREIQLLSGKKELVNDKINVLLILLGNQLSVSLRLKKFDEFRVNLENFKKYLRNYRVSKSPALRFYIIDFSYLHEIDFLCKTGYFEQAINQAAEFSAKLKESNFKLSKSDQTVFLNLEAQAYFGCGRYDEALIQLNQILNDKESEANYRNYCLAKIFYLLIHLELKNYDLLEYMVPSTYKYLVKKKCMYKYERIMINFLRKTLSINTDAELLESLKALKCNIRKLCDDRFEGNALEYFDIISWLESKIEKKSFASIVKSKA